MPFTAASPRCDSKLPPTNPEEPPVQVETAPMWLVSPPVPVEAGRVMLIHGWVKIPKRIVGSVDGLLILDSISGEPLAERILQTKDWQEFSLYRAVPRSGPMTVTFALCGLGEAFLDDVTVQSIERPALAAAPPSTAPPASRRMLRRKAPHRDRSAGRSLRPRPAGHRLVGRPRHERDKPLAADQRSQGGRQAEGSQREDAMAGRRCCRRSIQRAR